MLRQSIFTAMLLISIVLIAGCTSTGQVTSQPQLSKPLSVQNIKNSAITISYDDLMRNNANYVDQIVYYRGKIVQTAEVFSDNYVLRIATKQQSYLGYFDDIIWVNYEGSRVLEGDIVDIWGEVNGLKTYEAVLGNQITIPEIDYLHIELIQKAGETSEVFETTQQPPQGSNISVKFTISDVETSWFYDSGYIQAISYILENTGDVEIQPEFHVKITDKLTGKIIYEDDISTFNNVRPSKAVADSITIFKSVTKKDLYLAEVDVVVNGKEIAFDSKDFVVE